MSEGTSPSSSSGDGSRSTPSNLPKAATRASKKRTSKLKDEDYVAEEEEATSKRKVLKKEYGTTAAIKPEDQSTCKKDSYVKGQSIHSRDFGI